MNEQELKACPFCGHQAELRENEQITVFGESMKTFYVICGNVQCGIRTLESLSWRDAARIWNRRAQL